MLWALLGRLLRGSMMAVSVSVWVVGGVCLVSQKEGACSLTSVDSNVSIVRELILSVYV